MHSCKSAAEELVSWFISLKCPTPCPPDPCSILPLDVICNRIQADVMATLKDDADTKTVLAEAGLLNLLPAAAATLPVTSSAPASQITPVATNGGLVYAQAGAGPRGPAGGSLQVSVKVGADRN